MFPLLEIRNLVISFLEEGYSSAAVQDLSLTVTKGKITAIVGESGSGKSVTALSILQLLPKQAAIQGKVLLSRDGINQEDLLGLDPKKITRIRGNDIAMVFQEPMTSLNPVLTCGFQVMETITRHKKISRKKAKEKTIRLFEQVELPEPASILYRYPHEISGGQKQRVMIAMAICCEPGLLIADEPTTALDVRIQKSILQLIRNLQLKKDMGVLFITHDLGLVADIADEIIVMYKGRVVEKGNATEILKNPQHEYSKALIACRPVAGSKGKKLSVLKDFIEKGNQVKHENIDKPAAKREQTDPYLSIEGLEVYYPGKKNILGKPISFVKAVDQVSFEVNKGEITGLVGESGCGKTTLGRAILQLIKPTAGKIWLNGHELTTMPPGKLRAYRKEFQIVFQDPYGSLNPRITIGNAILEVLKVHRLYDNIKIRKDAVINMLEKVQLSPDHFERYPHQFSGGQRQRICIARALVLDPSFLVFDESVSALDVSVQAGILNLITELKNALNFTALFISHDLSVVHYICDNIVVMNKGKIIEAGKASEIYFNPTMDYTKQLIDAIPGKSVF